MRAVITYPNGDRLVVPNVTKMALDENSEDVVFLMSDETFRSVVVKLPGMVITIAEDEETK